MVENIYLKLQKECFIERSISHHYPAFIIFEQ
jgi:hypothetical protein